MAADYLTDPDAIYRASFAAIRKEADLGRLPDELTDVGLRLIHACGMIDILDDLAWSPGAGTAGRRALREGAPIVVDVAMVAAGVARRRLAPGQTVTVAIEHPEAVAAAARLGTTRSAAGLELERERLHGAVVVIGNAPTALFRLLELQRAGQAWPALVLGFPVGFVGAAEAKEALIAAGGDPPYLTLRGRRGGSALAAAALNALLPA